MQGVFRVIFLCVLQITVSHSNSLRAPPRVESRPNLSDSYVPALMQIIAHDTEWMKYEIKPQPEVTTSSPVTTTTSRSTPPHLPGVLQPAVPPKPSHIVPLEYYPSPAVTIAPMRHQTSGLPYPYYPVVPGIVGFIPFNNGLVLNREYAAPTLYNVPNYNFGQYYDRNGQYVAPNGQFATQNEVYLNSPLYGRSLLETDLPFRRLETRSLRKSEREQISELAKSLKLTEEEQVESNVEKYLGKGFSDVYKLANSIENDYDDEAKFLQFSKNFDDVDFGLELLKQLRQKRIPPTKAYVTLLNLYDELNKELKRLGFSKFTGYNQAVLKDLVGSSSQSSAQQMRFVLKKTIDNQDLKSPSIVTKMKNLLKDFDDPNGYIYKALSDVPSLKFSN